MRLVAQALFRQVTEGSEGGRVGGLLECFEDGTADAEREVELARSTLGEVVLGYEVDLRSKGLGLS